MLLSALLVGAMAALLGAAPASAAWTPYFTVAKSEPPSNLFATRVDIAPDGSAVFLWFRAGALQTRVRAPDGTFSAVRTIAPPGTLGGSGDFSDVAVDSKGTAFYVWRVGTDGRSVRARVRHPDGTLGPVQTLATAGGVFGDAVSNVHVGVDGAGRAVFSWIRDRPDGRPVLQARTRTAAGGLGPTLNLGTAASSSQLIVTPQGRAFFAWDGARDGVFARTLSAAGTLGPRLRLSASGGDADVASGGGSALFSWRQDSGDNSDARIMTREWSPGGSLGPPQVIARGNVLSGVNGKLIAMAPDGTAAYCWWASGRGQERVRSASGALGPIHTVFGTGVCRVAVDANANFVFLGSAQIGGDQRVVTRTQSAGGALSPVHVLSPAGYDAYSADLAVNARGDAAAVWYEGIRGFAVQGAFGP